MSKPWVSVRSSMATHPMFVEIFKPGPVFQNLYQQAGFSLSVSICCFSLSYSFKLSTVGIFFIYLFLFLIRVITANPVFGPNNWLNLFIKDEVRSSFDAAQQYQHQQKNKQHHTNGARCRWQSYSVLTMVVFCLWSSVSLSHFSPDDHISGRPYRQCVSRDHLSVSISLC